ncbi:pseudouridine synthase [Patescibacteria group bacterium]|nr:pseudouridine synthase [Patescibacteria group bacterium]
MRINKYLALKKYASRREADEFIRNGWVTINGKTAHLGDKVNEGDKVRVSERIMKERRAHLEYFAYNKPAGIVSTNPEEGQQSILDVAGISKYVFPLGRLDRESRGLILLTNDGRVTKRLLGPEYEHEKEYIVKVDKPLEKHFLKHLETGIDIEGHRTKPATVKQTGERAFRITLIEGKRHQLRRMCAAFGFIVKDLQRVRVMNIKLGGLKEGMYRKIEGEELHQFLSELGLRL